jgi:hypothetical protein
MVTTGAAFGVAQGRIQFIAVGTVDKVSGSVSAVLAERGVGIGFDVVSSSEF